MNFPEKEAQNAQQPAVNRKAVKLLNKLLSAGFGEEKVISAMTLDDMLSIPGITFDDISQINSLQKSLRAGKLLSFLCGRE